LEWPERIGPTDKSALMFLEPALGLIGHRRMEPPQSPRRVLPIRLPTEAADEEQAADHSQKRHTYEDDLHKSTD
jgi:hypothetical protein